MTSSISDVAARAGVSVATVSRALRGLPNVAVGTRDRVLQAAAELDYVVNPNASRLAAGHNHTIGVVCPHVRGWYVQRVLAGAQQPLGDRGYDMLLYTVPTADARERFLTLLPFRKRVDGLVLIDVPLSDPEQRMLAGLGTALVGVGDGGSHFPLIRVDERRGARLATSYLLDLGHRRIGLVTGPQDDPMRSRSALERRAGWTDALEAVGVRADPRWVAAAEQWGGGADMASGAEGALRLLRSAPGLTALVCASDELAVGALRALADEGVDVPGDLSVVGFDDQEIAVHLGLTSVHQPMELLGRHAVDLLFRGIDGLPGRGVPGVLPVSLAVRRTAAPLERPVR